MATELRVCFTLNGEDVCGVVTPEMSLLVLLKKLGINSVKQACMEGECGACTVVVDGEAMNSCLILAASAEGKNVLTLEGIGDIDRPHPLQIAFAQLGATQCGYCTPGFIMSAYALLKHNPNPTRDEIRYGLSGNLCRCTGYVRPIKAIELAAKALQSTEDAVDYVRKAAKLMLDTEFQR